MDRRSFFSLTAGALLSTKILPGQSANNGEAGRQHYHHYVDERTGVGAFESSGTAKRPHILLISADMVSPDMYLPSRPISRVVHLPAIHSLMQDGTFFSNTFCTVPLCSPSRASYLTGRYSYVDGNSERAPEGLETELRPDDIIFPEYLKAAGYITRQVGKCHVGAKKFRDAFGDNDQPWDRWSPPVFDDDEFLVYQRSLGVKPQKYSREIVFRMQDRKTPGNSAGGWVVQQDGKPFPIEAQYSYYLGKKTIEIFDNFASSGQLNDHPFYIQLDIFDPHQPFSIPAGFEERERELRRAMTAPDSWRAAEKRGFSRASDEPQIMDIYRRYWGIYDEKELIDYRVAYALQMEVVDRVIGMVLQHLKDLGLYNDTFIAFVSDHGEMNGRQALVDKGVYLHPDIVRVPMIFKPPKNTPRLHAQVDSPASLLDLSQTILEQAGIRPEARFDGISLMPAMRTGSGPEDRDLLFFGGWHVGVNFDCGVQARASDGKRYLYAYNCGSDVDQLFDLDSIDAVNLINSPRHTAIRSQLIHRLGAALESDPRWIGYWSEFRIARYNDLPKSQGDMQLFTMHD